MSVRSGPFATISTTSALCALVGTTGIAAPDTRNTAFVNSAAAYATSAGGFSPVTTHQSDFPSENSAATAKIAVSIPSPRL